MTSTTIALPTSGDQSTWNEQERALVTAAGLTRVTNKQTGATVLADRPTVEAFLQHCRRTGLDPIARQIYAIYRGGKWGIQISIDGARLVAERTKQYEGQTPVEWTADGVTWTQVWLSPEHPAAARVGVYRSGFREPLYAVATWESYAVLEDEWEGPAGSRRKTGRQVVSSMWQKFGPLMLGKCAEMLALRKAFPQDLSGLYSTEEMAQADRPAAAPQQQAPAPAAPAPQVVQVASTDWALQIADAGTVEELREVYLRAEEVGELGLPFAAEHAEHVAALVDLFALEQPPAGVTVGQMIGAVKRAIEAAGPSEGPEEVVDGQVIEEPPLNIYGPIDEAPAAGKPVTEWPTATPGGEA